MVRMRRGGVPGGAGLGGSGLLLALIAGGFALNASLYNGRVLILVLNLLLKLSIVDGGHRAIKYTR